MDMAQLARALQIVNTLDPGGFHLHHFQILITVWEAGDAGCTYADIEGRHCLSNAAVSRSVNAMSGFARHRKNAQGLVEIFRCPEEGRRYRIRLTNKGKSLMNSIEGL